MFNLKIKIMANFTSDDLAFTGYSKTVNSNNPEESNTIYIDKTEEFEVVNFCNQFLEKYKVRFIRFPAFLFKKLLVQKFRHI